MTQKQEESGIKKGIRELLSYLGVYSWTQFQGPMSSPKGVSDILGILPKGIQGGPGRFLAIEVKTKTGIVSRYQKEFIDKVNNSGGLGFVARSVDDVIDTLGVRDRFLF